MTKIPNIADIIAGYANQDKTLLESAADLGARASYATIQVNWAGSEVCRCSFGRQ